MFFTRTSLAVAVALFHLVQLALPPEFRRRYGASMEETFVDGLHDCSGFGRFAFVVRSLVSILFTVFRELFLPTTRCTEEVAERNSSTATSRETTMSSVIQDIRFSLRTFAHQPAFAIIVIFTIALGIGTNTAIFSVVNGVLLRPLSYTNPGSLVVVGAYDVDHPDYWGNMSVPDIHDVADLPAFEKLVGYRTSTVTLTGNDEPRLAEATSVSEGLLLMLGAPPLIGRDIAPEEAGPDGPRFVVVSHRLWQEQLFASDRVLGKTIEVTEVPHIVVGVAPPGFNFPNGTDIWRPDRLDPEGCGRSCRARSTIGRVSNRYSLQEARTQLSALGERLAREFETNVDTQFGTRRLQDEIVGDVEAGLWVVLGSVGLVLLIACGNVAILLLVRANTRQGEIAVRAALGASRGRLIRQLLVESQILAFAGAAVGVLGAHWAIGILKGLSAGTIPRIEQVTLDGPVMAFSFGVTVIVALAFGLAPVPMLIRSGMVTGIKSSGRDSSVRKGANRLRSSLLVFEVAMSIVLLSAGGLLIKTFTHMFSVDLGYETREIVRFTLSIPRARYQTLGEVSHFYRTLDEKISVLPGVASVGAVYGAPIGGSNLTGSIQVEGRPQPNPGSETYASVKPMTPGFFNTMKISLIRGRNIASTDVEGMPPVAVVNETFVEENFPDQDPLGQQITVIAGFGWAEPGWTIVGVVGDIRSRSLTRDPTPEVYVAHAQYGPTFMTINVRGIPGGPPLIPRIRAEVLELDANVPMRQIETMREAINKHVAPTRFYLILVVAFAGLAVLLTFVGLYGVVAYLVSRQTREIGIRVALGARVVNVLRMVATQGLYPVILGLVIGLASSLAATRVLKGLLFQVQPHDQSVLIAVSAFVILVSCIATLIPARRALRVDPVTVLRTE